MAVEMGEGMVEGMEVETVEVRLLTSCKYSPRYLLLSLAKEGVVTYFSFCSIGITYILAFVAI